MRSSGGSPRKVTCAGVRRCVEGRWTPCELAPEAEIPDHDVDDDCDGVVDDGLPPLGEAGAAGRGRVGRFGGGTGAMTLLFAFTAFQQRRTHARI